MLMLTVLVVTQFMLAQEATVAPPQNSTLPAEGAKQRSEKETRKRLLNLACGPADVQFSQRTDKQVHILPEQPPDKGLVYVIRTKGVMGAVVQAKLAIDGKWVGTNGMANYFYLEVEPGPHYFCVESGSTVGLLSLVIEKGKTYYLRQNLTMGGTDLDLLTDEKGKEYVAKYHRSMFEEKKK